MKFTYYTGNIALECVLDIDEIDRFDAMTGHYTEPGEVFIESVTHKGADITDLLSDEVLADIVEAFNKGE